MARAGEDPRVTPEVRPTAIKENIITSDGCEDSVFKSKFYMLTPSELKPDTKESFEVG